MRVKVNSWPLEKQNCDAVESYQVDIWDWMILLHKKLIDIKCINYLSYALWVWEPPIYIQNLYAIERGCCSIMCKIQVRRVTVDGQKDQNCFSLYRTWDVGVFNIYTHTNWFRPVFSSCYLVYVKFENILSL